MTRCRQVLLATLAVVLLNTAGGSAWAQTDAPAKFDHFSTGFPLIGAHAATLCESCHVRGSFKGTPRVCSICHNGVRAPGVGANHIPIDATCGTCHGQDTFAVAAGFKHNNVASMRCDGCHNGAFTGSGAEGKTPNHPRITPGEDCHECHNTISFAGAVGFDHTGITSGCNGCHLKDRPANHIPTPVGSECILCHRPSPDVFTQAALYNHGIVRDMRCDACHNGAYTAFGAPGKTPDHPPTQPGADCHECHSTASFADANFDHAGVTSGCARCHADDLPLTTHIPRPAGSECGLCHRTPPPDDFSIAALFNHSYVASMRCDGCHNGQFASQGAPGKIPGHPKTQPGQDCNACHKTTTSFADPAFDHTGVTSGCNTCHIKDVPALHITRPAGSECILCHRPKPDTFSNAALFNHSVVVTTRCDACHNGQFPGIPSKSTKHMPVPAGSDCGVCHVARSAGGGWTLATPFNHALVSNITCNNCHNGAYVGPEGKSAKHISSTNNCEKCHITTAWADTIKPLDHTQVLGSCNGCHLADLTPTHLPRPAGSDCGVCHTNPPPVWTQATKFNHSLVTAMRCDACHNGSYVASGALGKNAQHIPTAAGQDCVACHRIPPDTFAASATFSHASVTSLRCSQCHNGQFAAQGAVGKSAAHFVTTAECDRCHTTAPGWAANTATFVHQSANYPGNHNATVVCLDCHTTNNEAATWRNAALKPFCGGCHERNFVPAAHDRTLTPASQYTATELKDCTGACHVYATTVGGTISSRRNGPEHRANGGAF